MCLCLFRSEQLSISCSLKSLVNIALMKNSEKRRMCLVDSFTQYCALTRLGEGMEHPRNCVILFLGDWWEELMQFL